MQTNSNKTDASQIVSEALCPNLRPLIDTVLFIRETEQEQKQQKTRRGKVFLLNFHIIQSGEENQSAQARKSVKKSGQR